VEQHEGIRRIDCLLRYAFKRVVRNYRLFVALTIGVLLATTFFASTNVAADVLSREALGASIEDIAFDFAVDAYGSNWTAQDFEDMETSIAGLGYVTNVTPSLQFSFSYNNTGVNMTVAGVPFGSDLTSGLQLISGRPTLGPNETYVLSGSINESLFAIDQVVTVQVSVPRSGMLPYVITRNLTVAGYVSLPARTRDAILQNPFGSLRGIIRQSAGSGGAIGFTFDSSYNIMLADWDGFVKSVLDEADSVENRLLVGTRNLLHIRVDRNALLDPYDIGASITRLSDVGDQISNRVAAYGGSVVSNLQFPLLFYQFTQLAMNAQFLSLSLPIFLLAYFTGTMVSEAGYNFRRREIGLLLTKGYERGTIKRMFLVEGALVGGIAGGISIFLGTSAAYLILGLTDFSILEAVFGNAISVVLAIILGMFLGLFSVWRPAGRASKLEIIDALKQYVYVEEKSEYKKLLPTLSLLLGTYKLVTWLLGINMSSFIGSINLGNFAVRIVLAMWSIIDGLLGPIAPLLFLYGATRVFMKGSLRFQETVVRAARRFFGSFGNLATRNVKRNPGRTATLVFIVSLIVSYGVFSSGSLYSQYDFIERSALFNVGADVRVELDGGANVTTALAQVENYTSVIDATPEYHLNLKTGSTTIEARGIRPDEWKDVAFWEPSWFLGDLDTMLANLSDDGIILSLEIAKQLELDVGDTFYVDGPFSTGSYPLTIVGLIGYQSVLETLSADFGYGFAGDYVSYVSEDFLNESMLMMTSTQEILVDTSPDANGTALQADFLESVDNVYATYSVASEIADYQTSALRSGATKMQWLAITFAVILAMVGTGLVVILALQEKNAEIALLSVRGFSNRQLFKTLLAEVMVTILFALVLGLGVGFIEILGQVSQQNTGIMGLVRYRPVLGGPTTLSVLILLGVVLLAAIVPVWSASRRPETKVDILRA